MDIAKCNASCVFDLTQAERDDAWASLSEVEKERYKNIAKDYNQQHGAEARKKFSEADVLMHWKDECRKEPEKCSSRRR